MALALKVIGAGQITTTEGSLLLAAVGTNKVVIVKCMRFTNDSGGTVALSIKFKRTTPSITRLALKTTTFPNGTSIVDTGEVVLENGDELRGLTASGTVDYVISGIERDV